jgi:2-polyprenyl-6-methoxyphenol hydroxylase-like FAD-dependent oxidoreductase
MMHIVVIGAGIGGLSAAIGMRLDGNAVTVLESANDLSEFGAGLQLSPNAVRILDRWGLRNAIEQVAFAPARTLVRRYSSGVVLGKMEQNPAYQAAYGFP